MNDPSATEYKSAYEKEGVAELDPRCIPQKLDGPPPVDETQCTFLTLDSKTPYLAEYAGADAGKMAHYLLRWRMQDGSVSAFGETVSATITG